MEEFIKMLLAFLLGISMIWIKDAIGKYLAIRSKKQALKKISIYYLNGLEILSRYLEDASNRKISVYDHFTLPFAAKDILLDLIKLDLKRAHDYDLMYGNLIVGQMLIDDIHKYVHEGRRNDLADLYEKLDYRLMCFGSCCEWVVDGMHSEASILDEDSRKFLKKYIEKYENSEDPRFKELKYPLDN